jgi:hypothetical protein
MSDQAEGFKDFAEENNVPGAGSEEIRGKIISIFQNKNMSAAAKHTKIGNEVVVALEGRGKFFYHREEKDFASTMFFDTPKKTLRHLQSDQFQSWLSQWIAVNRADKLFTYVIREVENAALNGNTTAILPEHYWAMRDKAFYISNGDGELVKITAERVEPLMNGTDGVLFPCGKTLLPWKLVPPVDPFESCSIFRDASFMASHGKSLLKAWMLSLPTNPKCKPPLSLTGTVGSGKTRIARGIAELYGIPSRVVKADENGESNFWVSVNEGGLFTLDNADTFMKWLTDALAAAVTGGSTEKRKLYTNRETVELRANSWIAVTSANPTYASDPGLADRLLVIRMDRLKRETSDGALSDEISANRDGAISFIATTLSKALADDRPTPIGLNSRHPDFAAFAVRIGRAIGQEADFISALKIAESDKSRICVENDSIGRALMAIVQNGEETCAKAAVYADRLRDEDYTAFGKLTAQKFSVRVNILWPHLEAVLVATKKVVSGGAMEYSFARRVEPGGV